MNVFKQIHAAIIDALAVPGRFIEACNALSETSREQTRVIEGLHATVRAVEKSIKYLEGAQRRELQRTGHPHDF